LIGTPAAPLYKALIDSGLGEALAGGGLDDGLRQPMISIGLKGIDPVSADKIERLIADTVSTLADKGVDPLTVDAALNTIEFRLTIRKRRDMAHVSPGACHDPPHANTGSRTIPANIAPYARGYPGSVRTRPNLAN
jgi:hypothetical protein